MFEGGVIEQITINEVCDWLQGRFSRLPRSHLLLPPIQRSLVWTASPQKMLDYWDSLERDWPSGLFLVERAPTGARSLGLQDRRERMTGADDFYLFDGQQRLTTILLGLGQEPLAGLRTMLTVEDADDRSSRLRLASQARPFGGRPEAPNSALLEEQRRATGDAFAGIGNDDASRARRAALEEQAFPAAAYELERSANAFAVPMSHRSPAVARALVADDRIRGLHLNFQEVKLENAAARELFFARLGQGGVQLTERERMFSLLKSRIPDLIDTVAARDGACLAMEPIDVAIAALRVAKADRAHRDGRNEDWHFAPATAVEIDEAPPTMEEIEAVVTVAQEVDASLIGSTVSGDTPALPKLLLPQLSRTCMEILVWLSSQHRRAGNAIADQGGLLRSVAVWWTLFVTREDKASRRLMRGTGLGAGGTTPLDPATLAAVLADLVKADFALPMPSRESLRHVGCPTEVAGLPSWDQLFLDQSDPIGGQTIRILATKQKQAILLFAQRNYLNNCEPLGVDPTMWAELNHLLDLDHLIPSNAFFGEYWSGSRFAPEDAENFRNHRRLIGNLVGNLSYSSASANRKRQDGPIDPDRCGEGGDISCLPCRDLVLWNDGAIAPEDSRWTSDRIKLFRNLILDRSARLITTVIDDARLDEIASRSAATIVPDAPLVQ